MIQGTMNQLATSIIQGSMAKSLKKMSNQPSSQQMTAPKPKMDDSLVMAPSTPALQEDDNPWNMNITLGTKSMATMAQAVYSRYDQKKKFMAHFDKAKKLRRKK